MWYNKRGSKKKKNKTFPIYLLTNAAPYGIIDLGGLGGQTWTNSPSGLPPAPSSFPTRLGWVPPTLLVQVPTLPVHVLLG